MTHQSVRVHACVRRIASGRQHHSQDGGCRDGAWSDHVGLARKKSEKKKKGSRFFFFFLQFEKSQAEGPYFAPNKRKRREKMLEDEVFAKGPKGINSVIW
jgi:hypothetical protein